MEEKCLQKRERSGFAEPAENELHSELYGLEIAKDGCRAEHNQPERV